MLVDFWAAWCQPCHILSPILERLAEEYAGRFVLAKVDVDANRELASRFAIQSIPAVKAFRDGAVAGEFVGVQPEEWLRAFLKQVVPSEAEDLVREAERAETSGDAVTAEATYRKALGVDPDHAGAAHGLSRIFLDRGDLEEVRSLVDRLPPDPETTRIRAEVELRSAATPPDGIDALRSRAEGGDAEAVLELAAAEAASGQYRSALDRCLRALSDGEQEEVFRELMVRIFEVLGEDHPMTREFRPRLASALF